MDQIGFIGDLYNYTPQNAFIAYISKANGKQQLLEELNVKLQFPLYFGFNWDALFDCLRDFNWISQETIAIVHNDVPVLTRVEFEIYLNILIESSKDWHEGDEHRLEIYFAEKDRKEIENMFNR